ncbi:hypothetical protein LTR97_002682 [Elasticomyces elasticus]|uniref:2EXR domain-containing protein n=1 Tax=Elasticomyces elasticus TaxID=574655 RepID=A0AAN7WQ21_9PEZI|nr:hypothetical protein LTR97_002682 [Elasticomyces elasticus]
MPAKPSFEDRLEACINTMLREEYPFTHTSIINGVASETAGSAARKIIKRKKACKQGVRPLQFMDLPPELRNRIHEYAVRYYDQWMTDSGTRNHEILTAKWSESYAAMQPAITKVSRQLRSETLEMFYATNQFVITLDYITSIEVDEGTFKASKWLRAIGTVNATHIKDCTILFTPRYLCVPIEEILAKTDLSLVAGIAKLESRP